jgi:hypothetical protein
VGLVQSDVAVAHKMQLQFLGKEVFRKDNRYIFAGEPIKGDSFDCKNIISHGVSNNKEVRSILRFREVRNEDFLILRAVQSL